MTDPRDIIAGLGTLLMEKHAQVTDKSLTMLSPSKRAIVAARLHRQIEALEIAIDRYRADRSSTTARTV